MTRAIAVGNAHEVSGYLEDMDKLLLNAGVTNFTARELFRLRKVTPAKYAIPPLSLWANLVNVCKHVAEPLRARVGVPLLVVNGYRPTDYNEAVGGAPHSSHLKGYALDVTVGDVDGDRDVDGEDKAILRAHAADLFVELDGQPIGVGFYLGRVHIEWGRRRLHYASPGSNLDDREIEAARERRNTQPIALPPGRFTASTLDDDLDE